MSRSKILLGWLLLTTTVSSADISGRITVSPRNATPPVMISPYSRNRYSPPQSQNQMMDQTSVVLYLKDHPALSRSEKKNRPIIIDQLNVMFVPHLTILEAGNSASFRNSDNIYHNIFSLSKINRFNLGRYPTGEERTVLFENVGTVDIFCDIHSEMNGVVLVVPNAYFATPDDQGNYTIFDVPDGDFELTIWQEYQPELVKQVSISPDDTVIVLNFDL